MLKRTYPDQADFWACGVGDGFLNMGQLYTFLEDWEADIASPLSYPCPFIKPYWSMGIDPAGVLLFFSTGTTSIFYFVIK